MSVIFSFIQKVFAVPLGFILSMFYDLTNNYILAIVLLTIVVKLCFLPMSIGQQKAAIKNAKLNAKINLLKAHYQNDPEKQKTKIKTLKDRENSAKRSFGWMRTVVQFIVLIGLYGVIYAPLSSVLHVDKETIAEMQSVVAEATQYAGAASTLDEITLLKETAGIKDILLANNILNPEQVEEIICFNEQYNFFGMTLSEKPTMSQFDAQWIAPILVLGTGTMPALYSTIRRRMQYKMKGKFLAIEALPFLSPMLMFLLAFLVTSGVGLYWAISSFLSFLQNIILNVVYNPLKVSVTLEDMADIIDPVVPEPMDEIPTADVNTEEDAGAPEENNAPQVVAE